MSGEKVKNPNNENQRSIKGWQITLIVVLSVILVLGIIATTVYFSVFYGNNSGIPLQSTDINGFYRVTSYIGKYTIKDGKINQTLDLKDVFTDKEYKKANFALEHGDRFATIDKGNLTTKEEYGQITVKVVLNGRAELYDFEIVSGVNVFNFNDLVNVVQTKQAIVLQSDIETAKITTVPSANEESIRDNTLYLYNNLYGNAFKINGTDFLKDENGGVWDTLFSVKGKDVLIKNVHILGINIEKAEGEEIILDDYADGGSLIKFSAESREEFPTGSIENCILEKAHKIVLINGSDVTMKGNIIRDAGDACISIETSNVRTSKINLSDNILIHPQVAGIVFWLWEKNPIRTENYVTLNISGILDIYNWKNENTAAMMPASESYAALVNPIIKQTIAGTEYDDELIMQNGHKWIHVGIAVISTGGSENLPTINGIGQVAFTKRKFPLPKVLQGIIGKILKTTDMYGYQTIEHINPETDFTVSKEMFDKIWAEK